MRLTDIPKHVTQLNPPWFRNEFAKKYKRYPGSVPPDYEDVEPCFHLNYYDGPLSGIIRFNEHYFYAKSIYGDDRKWWASWELASDELDAVMENNRLFQEYVGCHNSYKKNEDGEFVRDLRLVKPQESWGEYYKNENKPKVDYSLIEKREIFGILENPFWSR